MQTTKSTILGKSENARRLLRSFWIHPLAVFGLTWGATAWLYDLHLSALLIYPTELVLRVVAWIVIPFSLTVLVYLGLSSDRQRSTIALGRQASVFGTKLDRKLKIAFAVWASLTVIEIVISGGVPILWLFQGSSQTYADFGVASVHGFLNSLLLTIGLLEFSRFVLDEGKKHLVVPAVVVLWSLIAVTRNMLIVILLECALVWAMIRGITWKTVAKALASLIVLILVFGYIGDVRTGSQTFLELAQPAPNFPEWLPSGALWVYIYACTPINNLVNTVQTTAPLDNALFPNATSLLFPSVVREAIYSPETISDALSGDLVAEAFNVSTAYVGPFQDYGMMGITLFSIVMGTLSAHYWRDLSLRGSLIYAVLAQCLAISIFFNHLFYLPVITQVFWLYFFLPNRRNVLRRSSHDQ
jgi:oligosaccharide repeat unit polymerase